MPKIPITFIFPCPFVIYYIHGNKGPEEDNQNYLLCLMLVRAPEGPSGKNKTGVLGGNLGYVKLSQLFLTLCLLFFFNLLAGILVDFKGLLHFGSLIMCVLH